MSTSNFTTWKALYKQMLDDLAGTNTTLGSYEMNGRSFTYRSYKDFMRLFKFVEDQARNESGDVILRGYARQGGRD